MHLTAESVKGPALSLQSIDNIHGGDCLALGVLCVCDGITDHVLQENLQHTSGFFVDQARDSLHSTTASQTANCWLGYTLDVITQNFPVTLGASFSQSLSSLSTSRHFFSVSIGLTTVNEPKTCQFDI